MGSEPGASDSGRHTGGAELLQRLQSGVILVSANGAEFTIPGGASLLQSDHLSYQPLI